MIDVIHRVKAAKDCILSLRRMSVKLQPRLAAAGGGNLNF